MANRPVFIPHVEGPYLVEEARFEFTWHPGFAPIQKKKNVVALHASAAGKGLTPLLEVSTKSEERLGQRLSAFSLKVKHHEFGEMPLECAYQGSKVFERGGPFTDLYAVHPREAKKDQRLRESGRLVEFRFDSAAFPLNPKTAFYDWLYISALYPHRDFLQRLYVYAGFTDIEFNPEKSINCQARSCATLVALMKRGILDSAMQLPQDFISALQPANQVTTPEREKAKQSCLFTLND